jgi:hypothetical protein
MKFSELPKKDQVSKIKMKFGDLVTSVLNNTDRIAALSISDDSKAKMIEHIKSLDEKNKKAGEEKGCVCQDCHDQEEFKKMPIDAAFEPLIEVAKTELEKENH